MKIEIYTEDLQPDTEIIFLRQLRTFMDKNIRIGDFAIHSRLDKDKYTWQDYL